ncbi:MAG TPA: hypothetical protein VMW25_04750 [Clostridia bacterium]|nr:hypothetical protein [Clostridia bacterium]
MRAKKQEITLTLDMAWDLCLEQWDWVKAEKEANPKLSASTLKGQWCEENGFEDIYYNCFFCEYANQQPRIDFDSPRCDNCPGCLVDPEFDCNKEKYYYCRKPLEFRAELVRLNKIRLELKE